MSGPAGTRQRGLALLVKRTIDVCVAALLLLLTSPLLLVAATVIGLTSDRPILFRHQRPGKGGAVFTLLKLRTMRDETDTAGRTLEPAERVTRIGRLLRATSVDELPQLWNVIRGEMSLVGPRPLLICYLSRYDRIQAHRHDVLPGITGLAQVSGRNALGWEQKLGLDLWYVENWSLGLDAKILARTFLRVIRRSGVSEPSSEMMPDFASAERDASPPPSA